MRTLTEVQHDVTSMIDSALALSDVPSTVERIKQDLSAAIRNGSIQLDDHFYQPKPDTYARRLLCRNETVGYTAVVMTWGPGQGTAVHDHAGMWCVEGVVQGRMDVIQYDLDAERDGLFRFSRRGHIRAGVGSAGCLIPPYEYHVLVNSADTQSMTLHIYGGEMVSCHIYSPRPDGWYERRLRRLAYDD